MEKNENETFEIENDSIHDILHSTISIATGIDAMTKTTVNDILSVTPAPDNKKILNWKKMKMKPLRLKMIPFKPVRSI